MSNLSQQVQELEQRAQTLEHQNKILKAMLYRVIATNGNRFEPIGYNIEKAKCMYQLDFHFHNANNTINCTQGVEPITPNNTPDHL